MNTYVIKFMWKGKKRTEKIYAMNELAAMNYVHDNFSNPPILSVKTKPK